LLSKLLLRILNIEDKIDHRMISDMAAKIKRHILIIDDEPTWLKISSLILRNCGYDVYTAGSGKEALKALTNYKPDLILSDVRMPDMNGFDLVDNLKRIPAASSTPVIFFSAIDDYDARKVARTLGAVDYLVKPFNQDDVSSVLSKHLPI
jgi:two-component system, cell cycle response regulator